MVLILGVVKLLVVARGVPPVATLYQMVFPALEVAFNTTEPASQRLFGVVAVMVGVVFTVAITAILGELQVPLALST